MVAQNELALLQALWTCLCLLLVPLRGVSFWISASVIVDAWVTLSMLWPPSRWRLATVGSSSIGLALHLFAFLSARNLDLNRLAMSAHTDRRNRVCRCTVSCR